jgi:hypothetical protein
MFEIGAALSSDIIDHVSNWMWNRHSKASSIQSCLMASSPLLQVSCDAVGVTARFQARDEPTQGHGGEMHPKPPATFAFFARGLFPNFIPCIAPRSKPPPASS